MADAMVFEMAILLAVLLEPLVVEKKVAMTGFPSVAW